MRYPTPMRVMSVLLIVALIGVQTVSAMAEAKDVKRKARVAFIGVYFEKTPERTQQRFSRRILSMLENVPAFDVINPDEVRQQVSSDLIDKALAGPSKELLFQIAGRLDVDYLYGGNLANQSRDESRVLLVGELFRVDRKDRLYNRFEIARYTSELTDTMKKFHKQFVKTVSVQYQAQKTVWPWLVLAGVAVAGLIAMSLTSSRSNAEGTGPGPITDRP
ncbi:MAG: hypothetical protein Q9P14_02810 [candidate division KSB1 bacterium]|nr:hypothetical protein [candidate division KSB1 bacterium]MDQ7064494.1 hypothetical protein [candidate division KSB1 bacterium]